MRNATKTQDEHDLEAADRNVERCETALDEARARRAEVENRRKDVFEDGTYLIFEFNESAAYPAHVFTKRDGQWWSSQQASSPVGWNVVRRKFEDTRYTFHIVETHGGRSTDVGGHLHHPGPPGPRPRRRDAVREPPQRQNPNPQGVTHMFSWLKSAVRSFPTMFTNPGWWWMSAMRTRKQR